jgi:hypothetical protein
VSYNYRNPILDGKICRCTLNSSEIAIATGVTRAVSSDDAAFAGVALRWANDAAETVVAEFRGSLPRNLVRIEPQTPVIGFLAFDFVCYKRENNNADLTLTLTFTIGGNSVIVSYLPAVAITWATAYAARQRIDLARLFRAAGHTIRPGDAITCSFNLGEAAGTDRVVLIPDSFGALVMACHDSIADNNNQPI